jgi:small subunit ribosomal protein S17e
MGRIKTTLVKRTSRKLVETTTDSFAKDFESNKKALGNTTMPSKRMRNMVAGYITRLKRQSQKIIDDDKQE